MALPTPAFIAQRISTTPSTAYLVCPLAFCNPAEEILFSHCLVPPNRRTPRTLIMPALPSPAQLTPGAHLSPAALFSVTRHHSCRATPFLCPLSIASSPCPAQLTSGARPAWPSLPAFTSSLALFPLRRATIIRTASKYCNSGAQRCSVSQPSRTLPTKPYNHCLQHQLT